MAVNDVLVEQIEPDLRVVALVGQHDAASVGRIRTALLLDEPAGKVVIDLSRATFIDSSVARAIFERAEGDAATRGEPSVAVVAPSYTYPARVLRVLGLDRMLLVSHTRAGALAALGHRAARGAESAADRSIGVWVNYVPQSRTDSHRPPPRPKATDG